MSNAEFFNESAKSFEKENIRSITITLSENEMLIFGVGLIAIKNILSKNNQHDLINIIERIQDKIYKGFKK
jgi:hypothetical protein